MDIFSQTTKPNFELINRAEGSLGEFVANGKYETAEIVILGFPSDEIIKQNGNRAGAALAPDKIREEFYKFTHFGINRKFFDLGNTIIHTDLAETYQVHQEIILQVLKDQKRLIILGGGNDLSYLSGSAMSQAFGQEWLGVNISSHFSKSHLKLLNEKKLKSEYFYEGGFQNHLNSVTHFKQLQNFGANLVSLEQLRSQENINVRLRDLMREQFIHHTSTINTMFSFDLQAVRASDAPGTTVTSPIGLRSGEFLNLVEFARNLVSSKIIEFTEVNPNFDIDNTTAKLVAIAIHRICSR
ncbi:MAG: arginase family protein [Pyrinomonadaceae bacterium]|nr:arginase family protein [Pyrinomonadaceae bacterium]